MASCAFALTGISIGEVLSQSPAREVYRLESDDLPEVGTVSAAIFWGPGGIVLADGAAGHLWHMAGLLAPSLRPLGRKGSGPGEFVGPRWVSSCGGDSLAVWDPPSGRLTILSPQLQPAREAREIASRTSKLIACGASTAQLLLARTARHPNQGIQIETGRLADGTPYSITHLISSVLIGRDLDRPAIELDSVIIAERLIVPLVPGGPPGSLPRPLGFNASAVISAGTAYILQPRGTVLKVDLSTGTRSIISLGATAVPATRSALDSGTRLALGILLVQLHDIFLPIVAQVRPPRTYYPQRGLLADDGAGFWLHESGLDSPSTLLTRFGATGARLRSVTLPGECEALDVRHGRALAKCVEADGEEALVVFELPTTDR